MDNPFRINMKVIVSLNDGYEIGSLEGTGFVYETTKRYEALGLTIHRGSIDGSEVGALREHPAVLSVDDNEIRQILNPDPNGPQ